MRWTVGTGSEFVVVATDPEYADMSNPRGEIIEDRFFLVAEDAQGNRRRVGSFESEDDALEALPFAVPVEFWEETYPVYGSPAFEAYGQDELIAWERRLAEDERWARS